MELFLLQHPGVLPAGARFRIRAINFKTSSGHTTRPKPNVKEGWLEHILPQLAVLKKTHL
jgi:hypothetical protein